MSEGSAYLGQYSEGLAAGYDFLLTTLTTLRPGRTSVLCLERSRSQSAATSLWPSCTRVSTLVPATSGKGVRAGDSHRVLGGTQYGGHSQAARVAERRRSGDARWEGIRASPAPILEAPRIAQWVCR